MIRFWLAIFVFIEVNSSLFIFFSRLSTICYLCGKQSINYVHSLPKNKWYGYKIGKTNIKVVSYDESKTDLKIWHSLKCWMMYNKTVHCGRYKQSTVYVFHLVQKKLTCAFETKICRYPIFLLTKFINIVRSVSCILRYFHR